MAWKRIHCLKCWACQGCSTWWKCFIGHTFVSIFHHDCVASFKHLNQSSSDESSSRWAEVNAFSSKSHKRQIVGQMLHSNQFCLALLNFQLSTFWHCSKAYDKARVHLMMSSISGWLTLTSMRLLWECFIDSRIWVGQSRLHLWSLQPVQDTLLGGVIGERRERGHFTTCFF